MEQKTKAMLIIDPPSELRFLGPFNKPVVTLMRLSNPSDQLVLFKIKTTAPKRYCVRPNFGSVQPFSNTKVEICLQPFVYDANDKNKHKFMVQSLVAPEDCDDPNKVWKDAEPEQLVDAKLRCVFEMPSTTSSGETSAPATNSEAVKEEKQKEEKILNLQTSDQTDTLLIELRTLRDEMSLLRKENINLKDQVLRQRVSQPKLQKDDPYTPVLAEKQIPMFYVAFSFAMAIVGILIGKFIL